MQLQLAGPKSHISSVYMYIPDDQAYYQLSMKEKAGVMKPPIYMAIHIADSEFPLCVLLD